MRRSPSIVVAAALAIMFDAFVTQNEVKTAPQLLDIIEPPTYDTLEALIVRLDASLHASTAPTAPTLAPTTAPNS